MLRCGLLGEKLQHSYSPAIHKMLGDYEYKLYEKSEAELDAFMTGNEWDCLNVTIPYKKAVIKYLTHISDGAKMAGSVNTIVRNEKGELCGYNTDVTGFEETLKRSGADFCGKKALILGNGGAAGAVRTALSNLGAKTYTISRSGEFNYQNLELNEDAEVIVNTTPLGMYPNCGVAAVDLERFKKCKYVFDLIYNPARTRLLLQAEKLGMYAANGLFMLTAQAVRASEIFTGATIGQEVKKRVYESLCDDMTNIVLVGMPGSGKSSIAQMLGSKTKRPVLDSDEEIFKKTGRKPADIINEDGEETFRKIESEVLAEIGKLSGIIVATGGGVVTREENYDSLHQNGRIYWIKRDLNLLATDGRPLSQKGNIEEIYKKREPLYSRFADATVLNDTTIEEAVIKIRGHATSTVL